MHSEASNPHYPLALPAGTLLADRYRLLRPIGESSAFAITYLADDQADGATAVLKEFFPRSLVGRDVDGSSVRPHSQEDERAFVRALRRFVHEGALLADISHPHLVRATRLVEAHGTAYLVMAHHQGQPLTEYVHRAGGRLAPAQAGMVVESILSALEPLHAESIVHRGIAPQSVCMLAGGRPIVFGFAARRHVAGQSTDLVPGFAAFEQYGTRDVGPWTDVYGAAALLYYLLTGSAPPSALERAAGEALVSPGTIVSDVAPMLGMVVLRGLALLPQQRPHAASEFRRQLETALNDSGGGPARAGSAGFTADGSEMLDGASAEADARSNALKFAPGGIVVPNEESGTARLLRRFADAAARLRRSPSPDRVAAPLMEFDLPEPAVRPRRVPMSPPVDAAGAEAPHDSGRRDDVTADSTSEEQAATSPAPTRSDPNPMESEPAPRPRAARAKWARGEATRSEPTFAQRRAPPVEERAGTPPAASAIEMTSAAQPAPAAPTSDETDLATRLGLSTEDFAPTPRPTRRRVLLSAAAGLVLVAGTTAALLVRSGKLGASDVSQNERPLGGSGAGAPVAPSAGAQAASHEIVAAGAVLQSDARRDSAGIVLHASSSAPDSLPPSQREIAPFRESAPTTSATAKHAPALDAGRVPAMPRLNVTIPVSTPELRMVPPEVLVEARSRLTNGQEQTEQGEYVAARRSFRTALQQLDSASARYPESQAIRSLRREVELADARTLKACLAENEFHKRRGDQPGACQ